MDDKNTVFYKKSLINCSGKLQDLSTPKVMGIINVTHNSFFDGGSVVTVDDAIRKAEGMLSEGATILDIGGMSTKPGADEVTVEEELNRVIPVIDAVKKRFNNITVSIDTAKAKVALEAVNAGASMVNDVSAGAMDSAMFATVAKMNVPYIIMHMQGTPATMQQNPVYDSVTQDILSYFIEKVNQLKAIGLNDILIDSGFGFGKTVEHNYSLLNSLDHFKILNQPIVVGISRKSMICKVLKVNPIEALNGTTALHAIALLKGADVLRVHDVKAAMEVIKLVSQL